MRKFKRKDVQEDSLKYDIIKNPPVFPYVITSPYGKKRKLDYKRQKTHTGIDFVGWNGKHYILDNIVATIHGKVVFARTEKQDKRGTQWGGRGNCVTIQSSENSRLYVCFYHLDQIYVKEGQIVFPTQKIGYMGNSGHSFGGHLHYEVKVAKEKHNISNGIPYHSEHIDPDTYFLGDFGKGSKKPDYVYLETLRIKSSGADVEFLQKLLNMKGYRLIVDGIFGSGTESVVKDFQEDFELIVDGIVGTKTWEKLI